MSTIDDRRTLPPLVDGEHLDRETFHERYEAMPSSTRAELIEGVVYMPSPMSFDHGDESAPVAMWLGYYAESTPGVRLSLGASILLDDRSEVQPDLSLRILPDRGGQVRHEEGYIVGSPELVVEISRSTLRKDLGPKFRDYERTGVCEYLVIGLDPSELYWFSLIEGRLERLTLQDNAVHKSQAFPGLWVEPDALLSGDTRRLRQVVDLGLATPEHEAFVRRLSTKREG